MLSSSIFVVLALATVAYGVPLLASGNDNGVQPQPFSVLPTNAQLGEHFKTGVYPIIAAPIVTPSKEPILVPHIHQHKDHPEGEHESSEETNDVQRSKRSPFLFGMPSGHHTFGQGHYYGHGHGHGHGHHHGHGHGHGHHHGGHHGGGYGHHG